MLLRCGFSAALCANDVISWVSRNRLDPDNTFVNPAVSVSQLNIISTKPGELKLSRSSELEMPLAVCYEIGRRISTEDDSAGCINYEAEQESFYDKTENEKAEVKTEDVQQSEETADNTAADMEEYTEKLLYEETVPGMRNPTYTMDKKTMFSLFTSTRDFNLLAQDVIKQRNNSGSPEKRRSVKRKETEIRTVPEQNTLKTESRMHRNVKSNESENKNLPEQLTAAAVTVYHTILDTPVYSDAIADSTGLPAGEVLSSLTELELYGLIVRLPGNRFVRKEQ